MSRFPWLSWPARAYIWLFRGSPLLVQVLILFNGFPRMFPSEIVNQILTPVACVLIAFSLNEGAYMAEIVRAGITSVDPGQMEAAKSLGMRYGLAMRRIVLPQAARVIVPPLGNEFNNMLKNTSLLFTIGVYEMFADAEIGYSNSFQPVEYFLGVAFWYLVLTTVWTFIQAAIERRLAVSERGEELSFLERVQAVWNPVSAWRSAR